MCTCIELKNKDLYFGRNLDLEYNFGEKVVITPRNYKVKLKSNMEFNTKYAIIGMATTVDGYPLYADASNEKGLCIAGLNFPGNAVYNKRKNEKINIASFELIPWILGNFSSISELREKLEMLNITEEAFNKTMPPAQLHWMISDKESCIVLELVKEGLKIYNNEYGVLTNNPEFSYHRINVSNYMNVTAEFPNNRISEKLKLDVYGQGIGMYGLPGDVTPASRFVRAVFNKFNSYECNTENEAISQFFHILDSVSVINGTVITKENKAESTKYSSCINASKGIYYFKTYYNNQINAVKLNKKNINSNKLEIFELPEGQNINYLNE